MVKILMVRLLSFIRQNFVSGLAVFIPFVITTYLVLEVGKWLNSLVSFTPARYIKLPEVINPFFTEIILFIVAAIFFILLITILGLATKNLLGKLLVKFGEKTFKNIPSLVGLTYLNDLNQNFIYKNITNTVEKE